MRMRLQKLGRSAKLQNFITNVFKKEKEIGGMNLQREMRSSNLLGGENNIEATLLNPCFYQDWC